MTHFPDLRRLLSRYWMYICIPACVLWVVWTYSSGATPIPRSPLPTPYVGCDTADTVRYKSQYNCGNGWPSDSLIMTMELSCRGGQLDTFAVHYCFPDPRDTVYPKEQYLIRAITDLKDTCTFTAEEMREIGRKLLEANPQCFPCSMRCNPWCKAHPECPCPALYPEWRASWSSCFRKFAVLGSNDDTLSFGFVACGAAGVCTDLYHVCCDSIDSVTYKINPHIVASVYTEECKSKDGTPIFGCDPVCAGPPPSPNPPLPPCDTTGNGIIGGGGPAMSEKVGQQESKNNPSQKAKNSVVTQQPPAVYHQEQKKSKNKIHVRQQ